MENMKAVRVHNYGGPEVPRFEDSPRPTRGSGELLIRVHAASVNPIDWKIRAGYMKDHIPLPLPFIPGWDVSGVSRPWVPVPRNLKRAMKSTPARMSWLTVSALTRNTWW
jgi:hypothetical protein